VKKSRILVLSCKLYPSNLQLQKGQLLKQETENINQFKKKKKNRELSSIYSIQSELQLRKNTQSILTTYFTIYRLTNFRESQNSNLQSSVHVTPLQIWRLYLITTWLLFIYIYKKKKTGFIYIYFSKLETGQIH
jgi:hypothetical protein